MAVKVFKLEKIWKPMPGIRDHGGLGNQKKKIYISVLSALDNLQKLEYRLRYKVY